MRKRKKRPYRPEVKKNMNLGKLIKRFGCEDRCNDYLAGLRWPDGIRCPRCKSEKVFAMPKRRIYECKECEYQFSVRVGTIFHDSKLPLWKWFAAVYMMAESKKGISANQLKRMLNVSYKTAWYLCHRIRASMKDEAPAFLRGIVEVDEAFIGGKRKRWQGGQFDNKACVVGAVERKEGGRVRLAVIPHRGKRPLHKFIGENVHDDTQEIHTDEWAGYKGIGDHNTEHKTVNHSQHEWVHADVHTNTCEGVWSLFKRSIVGSYHKLSKKHLPSYLDEMAFRYNNCENPYMFRDTLLKLISSDRVEYKKLTA
ncbi:MAG: IS1595 family transposase [Acidobacteriota bacterium]